MLLRLVVLLLAAGVALTGCNSPSEPVFGRVSGVDLPPSSGVLLLLVNDATDAAGEPVAASGDALQTILRSNFVGRGWDVFSAETSSRVAGAERARQLGLAYFIDARFPGWHEATVKYKGDPDRVEAELRLFRSSDSVLVAYARGERRGGTLSDVDRLSSRLLAPLVEELLEGMLDGAVLASLPADD